MYIQKRAPDLAVSIPVRLLRYNDEVLAPCILDGRLGRPLTHSACFAKARPAMPEDAASFRGLSLPLVGRLQNGILYLSSAVTVYRDRHPPRGFLRPQSATVTKHCILSIPQVHHTDQGDG